jgi:PPIC-type PPIASE domain
MRYCWLVFLLFSAVCFGQVSGPENKNNNATADDDSTTSPVSVSKVAPNATIITINGLCSYPASNADRVEPSKPNVESPQSRPKASTDPHSAPVTAPDCKTTVSREQFEGVVNVINPRASIEKRRRFATDYAQLLLFDRRARQLGLDKAPDFQEFLQFKYSQALEVVLTNYMQGQANEISDAEVEKYYEEHPERFEEIALLRIFVPVRESAQARADPDNIPDVASAADRAAMQETAEKIQREAMAGGDFAKLEAEAYKAAQVTVEEPPDVDLGDKWTIDNLPPEHKDRIPKMKSGEVSPLIVHPLGWQIFKVTAKRKVPLSEAKPWLQSLRMKDAMQSLKKSIDPQLNEAYFSGSAHPPLKQEGATEVIK